jgi:uncharacterized coiled-coil protein SlyX
MNDVLIQELKETISKLNVEIIEKRKLLDSLIEQYQNLSETLIDEDIERV